MLVDGAKRDRVIWPGDMGVSTATAFATTGDTYSSRMSIETLYQYQLPNGMLPYVVVVSPFKDPCLCLCVSPAGCFVSFPLFAFALNAATH